MKRLFKILPQGSILLAITTLGSYVLGLVRDRTLAQTFGAGSALDAYNAAFLLPDFLFNVLVASGIAAAFVPLYIELSKESLVSAERYANTVLTTSILAMGVTAFLFFIFAESASALVAPGFHDEQREEVASLLRILSLSPIIFAASNTLGSLLVAKSRFVFYGFSPLLYNVGIIGGALFLSPYYGVRGVAVGTVLGALLHLSARLIDAMRLGVIIRPRFDIATKEFNTTLRLMLPKMVGHPVELATFWGFTALASLLAPGSIAVVNLARNFQSVPVSIIGLVLATTTFPLLARAATESSSKNFLNQLKKTSALIMVGSIFSATILYLIREPLIALLLGGKAFSADDVSRTATTLGVFTLSIPTEALNHLLARAFYATKNTTVPVTSSILSLIISLGGAWLLMPLYGLTALPFAFFLGSILKIIILAVLLPARARMFIRG